MNTQAKLKFSEDGKEVNVIFKDGSESITYGSRAAFLEALLGMADKKKIDIKEFAIFRDSILEAKHMPWSEGAKTTIRVLHIGGAMGFMPMLDIFASILPEMMDDEEHEVAEASFQMCTHGEPPHGHFRLRNHRFPAPFFSKKESMDFLEKFKTDEIVSPEEFLKVKKEIEESLLPETVE